MITKPKEMEMNALIWNPIISKKWKSFLYYWDAILSLNGKRIEKNSESQ
jgi:hypothetical protein